jgi:hypothetical protein
MNKLVPEGKQMKRNWLIALVVILAVLLVSIPVYSDSPEEPSRLATAITVKERHQDDLIKVGGVTGVGIGLNENDQPEILVFTETAGVRGLPASLDGIAVKVQVSGQFVAQPKPERTPVTPPPQPKTTDRWPRPVPIGVSTGHPDITAGTIGARVIDRSGHVYALSNNHVYANSNMAASGDNVLQPGTYDHGRNPVDAIGRLFAFKNLDFSGGDNVIDAAIAATNCFFLGNTTPLAGYGIPKSNTTEATVDLEVKKFGRTTGLTRGRVYATDAVVSVRYSDSEKALFVDQIVITGSQGSFSAGGDSGSLIVTDSTNWSMDRIPVGLLYAGSSQFTVANPIQAVLDEFGVSIDGERQPKKFR